MNTPETYNKTNIYDEQGNTKSTDLDDYLESHNLKMDDLESIFYKEWQSDWSEKERYQDSVGIYKLPTGYGVFQYTCGGWSSYTFEPEEVLDICETNSFDIFWNIVLTDKQREVIGTELNYLRTEAGGLLYGR